MLIGSDQTGKPKRVKKLWQGLKKPERVLWLQYFLAPLPYISNFIHEIMARIGNVITIVTNEKYSPNLLFG